MAHLTRCWCGRVYRCERSHKPKPFFSIFRSFTKQHDKCPDYILHGHLKVEFTTITVPAIEGVKEWPSIQHVFEE